MDFSEVLKELRESNNLTQEELAKQLTISRSTIAGYENRNRQPDYDKLVSISRFFQVSVDYLLTGEREPIFSSFPLVHPNEKALDRKVFRAYHRLGYEEKKATLSYIELLEFKMNHSQS